MLRTQCPFCDHVNPADSKFCNACGVPLHLAPCPHCGAVNEVVASICCKCGAPLPPSGAEQAAAASRFAEAAAAASSVGPAAERKAKVPPAAPDPGDLEASPADRAAPEVVTRLADVWSPPHASAQAGSGLPVVSNTLPRQRVRAIFGVALVATLAGAGYYAYQRYVVTDAPQPTAASTDQKGRNGRVDAGTIRGVAPAAAPASAVGAQAIPTVPEGDGPPAGAAADQRSAPVADSERGDTVKKAVVPGTAATSSTAASAASSRPAVNPARASRESARSSETAATAAVAAPSTRPPTNLGGGIAPPTPDLGPCTDRLTALGLCATDTTSRRE